MVGRHSEVIHPLVCVVDDDVAFRKSLDRLIQSFGFRVAVFRSGAEFLNSGRVTDTACLVLDVRMPGMSGLELQRRLTNAHRQIPIIFITGLMNEDERQRALEAGAVAFLHKPVNDRTFLRCIQLALRQGFSRPGKPEAFELLEPL